MSVVAVGECLAEMRAACRRPIDEAALDALVARLRHNFERILDVPDGRDRWAEHGQRMRDNGRHIGALADFMGYEANVDTVGPDELSRAFEMVSRVCLVGVASAV